MALYTCEKCGMIVGTMTCGHCDVELVHDEIALADGSNVFVAKCPAGHGKVLAPMCCGQHMTCTAA